jgi:hypothetical protein
MHPVEKRDLILPVLLRRVLEKGVKALSEPAALVFPKWG